MSCYRGPKCKIERRLEVNLFGRKKNILLKKNKQPGMHSIKRKKSAYRVMLEAKQRCSFYYGGIRKRQLIKILVDSHKAKLVQDNSNGVIGVLAGLLESRLDAIVRRTGFADTAGFSRQLISHGHVFVNNKRVDKRSMVVSPGSVVSLSPKAVSMQRVRESLERVSSETPNYLTRISEFEVKLNMFPQLESIPAHKSNIIDFSTVTEHLSKYL